MTGFHIDGDHLRAHAGHLESVGSAIDTAKDAAGTVHLDVHAFGIMNAELPPLFVDGHQQKASAMISSLSDALRRTADGVRGMATDYDGVDSTAEARFRAFDASLGVTP